MRFTVLAYVDTAVARGPRTLSRGEVTTNDRGVSYVADATHVVGETEIDEMQPMVRCEHVCAANGCETGHNTDAKMLSRTHTSLTTQR